MKLRKNEMIVRKNFPFLGGGSEELEVIGGALRSDDGDYGLYGASPT